MYSFHCITLSLLSKDIKIIEMNNRKKGTENVDIGNKTQEWLWCSPTVGRIFITRHLPDWSGKRYLTLASSHNSYNPTSKLFSTWLYVFSYGKKGGHSTNISLFTILWESKNKHKQSEIEQEENDEFSSHKKRNTLLERTRGK